MLSLIRQPGFVLFCFVCFFLTFVCFVFAFCYQKGIWITSQKLNSFILILSLLFFKFCICANIKDCGVLYQCFYHATKRFGEYEGDFRSSDYYLSCSENRALKKFRPVRDWNP